jgi:hypothetical protein
MANLHRVISNYIYSEFTASCHRATFVGKGDKEYIPLYALDFPVKISERFDYHFDNLDYNTVKKNLLDDPRIPNFIAETIMPSNFMESIVRSPRQMAHNLDRYIKDIYEWLNDDNLRYLACTDPKIDFYGTSQVKEVFNFIGSGDLTVGRFNFQSHFGALFHNKGNPSSDGTQDLEAVYCLVTKRENAPLIKRLYFLGLPIPNELLEMWVSPHLDPQEAKASKWKYIRTAFRKHVKPLLKDKQIPIIEREDIFDQLFTIPKLPTFKSPREYKEWLSDFGNRYLRWLDHNIYADGRPKNTNDLESILL